jgi:hypothetical protein
VDKGSVNNMRKDPCFGCMDVCKRDHTDDTYIREDMMVLSEK